MHSQSLLTLIMVTAILSLFRLTWADLTVVPFEIAAEPGHKVVFTCSGETNGTETLTFTWSFTNKTHTNITILLQNSDRIKLDNGTLTISNVTHNDAGDYKCDDDAGSESQTGVLIVYEMPDYIEDGLIIAGICLALLIVVIIGMAYITYSQRKRLKERKQLNDLKRQRRNGLLK